MTGPPLWIVERPGSRVFLFGETVGLRDDGWLDDELRAAVAASRVMWCEADRDELAASPLLARYALADEPLSARLDEARLARVQDVARGVGIEPTTLETLRPWAAGQVLEVALRSAAGYDRRSASTPSSPAWRGRRASRSARSSATPRQRSGGSTAWAPRWRSTT